MADAAGTGDLPIGELPIQGELPAKIAQLVAAHHEAVYRYAYRLTGSSADAEDLSQQAYLAALRCLDQLREGDRARSWLLAIVRNQYLKNLRRTPPRLDCDLNGALDRVPNRNDESTREGITNEIDEEQLQAALASLPEEFRVVVLMYYFEERPYREIAEALELPIGTVMSRLSRGKAHLKNRLAPRERDLV
jgi:RNA polymerase sigma-70 factor, ECF subfamily